LIARIKNSRLVFQQVNRSVIASEITRIENEIMNKTAENHSGRAYCNRISRLMIAKLVGGEYQTAKFDIKTGTCCTTAEQVFEIIAYVKENIKYDKMLVYQPLFDLFESLWIDTANILARKLEALDVNGSHGEAIETAQTELEAGYQAFGNKLDDFIAVDYADELAMYRINLTKTVKGTRKSLTFEVTNLDLVHRSWLKIDEDKVNAWMKDHEEDIRNNKFDIPGLRFGYSEIAVIGN
jgi:hypothetical protein